eukprot:m.20041 g.20041  ORF g.20041 m.20041 type:complete len:565 (+) comp3745_c0_seq1:573-2267(+)
MKFPLNEMTPLALIVGLALVLSSPGTHAVSSSHSNSNSNSNSESYWTTDASFLPQHKQADSCLHPSMKPLCNAMASAAGDNTALSQAASGVDTVSILASNDPSVVEDAHHWLAIAACRVCVNQNPHAKDTNSPMHVPASIGKALLQVSAALHREPAIGYAGLVLDNCVRRTERDPTKRPRLSDWEIQRTVTSAQADDPRAVAGEQGFYAAHCAVEEQFGYAINTILKTVHAAEEAKAAMHESDADKDVVYTDMAKRFRDVAFELRQVIPQLKNMRNFIHPQEFMKKVRNFLKCGKAFENGIVFEGDGDNDDVSEFVIHFPNGGNRTVRTNVAYTGDGHGLRGPTGAMTTTLSFVDNALGIHTSTSTDPALAQTMQEFAHFHPTEHAELIQSLNRGHAIRELVASVAAHPDVADHSDEQPLTPAYELVDAYNDAITAVTELRYAHVDHIGTYILAAIPEVVPFKDVAGTGNTPIAKYLCNAAAGTLDAQIPPARFRGSISVPTVCHAQCVLDGMSSTEGEGVGRRPALCDEVPSVFRRMQLEASYHNLNNASPTGGDGQNGRDDL